MPTGKKMVRRSRPAADPDPDPPLDTTRHTDDKSRSSSSRGRDIEMAQKKENPQERESKISIKSRSTINYRRPSDARVLESDMEDIPLSVDEVEDFLIGGGTSGEPYDGYYEGTRVHWEYQQDRRGGHMLFVENEETGELVLTDLSGDGGGGGAGGAGELEGDFEETPLLRGEDSDNSAFRPDAIGKSGDFSIMEKFFLASYLFFQGLLAGFTLALIYLVEQAESDSELLLNYQPSSNEIRRILFIFGAISFVGALEAFSDSWRRKRYASSSALSSNGEGRVKGIDGGKASSKRSAASGGDNIITQTQLEGLLLPLTWVALICFFVLFILLLVMAPTEVLISEKNGYIEVDGSQADDWVNFAFEDNAFRSRFDRWKLMSLYRVGFGLLGWIMSCLVVMVRYLLSSKRDFAMNGMHEYVYNLRKKISSLQGDYFDSKMTVEDYHRLINIQKLGVQRSEAALRAKEEHMLEDFKTSV